MQARVLLLTLLITTPLTAQADDLVVLLQQRNCPDCRLADVDLAHADLRYADLQRAQLQGANLGQARLDGANFKGADLSFTSLRGASLRGADFTGSRLYGTDLREADLSGALFNPKALEEAHWQGVTGVAVGSRSNARLHNAGVKAFQASRWAEAERLFTDAIRSDPNEPLSWVARGISRSEQAKDDLAAADFSYAAASYQSLGAEGWATQLMAAAELLRNRRFKANTVREGKGIGGQLLQGGMSTLRTLILIGAKALTPVGMGL